MLGGKQHQSFEIEDIGFWVNGDFLYEYQIKTKEMKEMEQNTSIVVIKSCIFFNFFDQIRAGLNSTVMLEKCHLSEAKNHGLYCVNPK